MFATILAAAIFLATSAGVAPRAAQSAPAAAPSGTIAARAVRFAPPQSAQVQLSAEEQEFIDRINAARTERGLYALVADPILQDDASRHSQDMAMRGYFSHTAPNIDNRTPMDRYIDALHSAGKRVPSSLLVGENIYYCSISRGSQDVALAEQALMDSPGHRANILDPRFSQVGIGIYRSASGAIWVTQVFLRKN